MTLKSQPGGWILTRKPDLYIARSARPEILTLEQAVAWIKRNRPALWVGSMFSVPEPSAFPSGYVLTRSLLEMIFPPGDSVPEPTRAGLIDSLIGKWPLERLLDEFELLHYDLSESLLDFFAVDAQGGEKLALMERLYSILTDDAVERNLMRDEFYFLSDELLASFKRMQGYDPATYFPGSRVEQAYLILAEGELGMRRAMAKANGVPMTDQPLLPGGLYLVFPESAVQPRKSIIVQNYVPRSKPSMK